MTGLCAAVLLAVMLLPMAGLVECFGAGALVATPCLSHTRGIYADPFSLSVWCETPGVTIRYTTDGTRPTESTGAVYAGPVSVHSTTYLRVAAFKSGSTPSAVQTHTYLFPDRVLEQPSDPCGFPAAWGSATADYEMDPEMVNDPACRSQMEAALRLLPSVSLVMSCEDLFGPSGIYVNWDHSGQAWERPGSVELIYPDGREGFQIDCGVRTHGDVGRRESKKSFRLLFKSDYGPTKLRYPLFGEGAADRFDQLVLRSGFNDAYAWGADRAQYIRDEYVRRLQLAMGHPSAHGDFVHLYINGLYWGLYNLTERPQSSFAAAYFGGDKDGWDALSAGDPVGDSSTAAWEAMLDLVRQGVETPAAYQRLQGNDADGTPNPSYVDYLDIDNYIDYLLVNMFVGNWDWPDRNWYAVFNRASPTGWKFFCWDGECVIGMNSALDKDVTDACSGVCEPYAWLRANPEFRARFGDRVRGAFSVDGPFYVDPEQPQWDRAHPERNRPAALYAELADRIESAMACESARWGDVRGGAPYRVEQWRDQRDWVLSVYMPARSAIVLNQLHHAGLCPEPAEDGEFPEFP
jgi:hypothetical protein